jgi:hypothetical protein
LINGEWHSYDSTPVAIPFAMAATTYDRYRNSYEKARKDGTEDTIATRAAAGALGALRGTAGAISHNLFLENLIEAVNLVTLNTKSPKQDIMGLAGSALIGRNVPISGMMNWMARIGDDFERDSREDNALMEIWNRQFVSRMPWSRQSLPESVDIRGRKIQDMTPNTPLAGLVLPTKISKDKTSVVVAILDEWDVPVDNSPKSMSVSGANPIELTMKERQALAKAYGPIMEDYVLKTVTPAFADPRDTEGNPVPPELARQYQQARLKVVVSQAREAAFYKAIWPTLGNTEEERIAEYRSRANKAKMAALGDYKRE